MITGKNYIGNVLSSIGKITFKTFNPKSNTENDIVYTEASQIEIDKAVSLATEAYKSFKNVSGAKKSEFLNEIANEIEVLGDDLIKTFCSETGLPEGRALGERGRTTFQLRSFANLVKEGSWVEATIDTAQPDRQPIPKVDIRKMMIPIGPVVVFGASNFPLAYSTAGGDTAAALAAGCPVIVKSHPMHAGTGELVASAIIKAALKTGMPNGVFSNLNSSGIDVGVKLVQHPQVKAVGFTGSIRGGRALFDMAAQRAEPIPVFAEMGSVNPVVILPNAAKNKGEFWAKTYAGSITLGSGQFCTNPGLILGMKGDDLSNFIQVLSEEIIKVEPSCMLHPNIIGAYENNKAKMQSQKGLQTVVAFDKDVSTNFARQIITTVEGATFLKNTSLHQEVFGPFSMVVQCEDNEQLEQIISNLEGQLTGTILTENDEIGSFTKVVAALQNRVGRIIYNGVPTGVEVCPAMVHGGPYPASTDSRFTAVGINSIKRWVRPFSFQSWPNELLPQELRNENPLGISRVIDGKTTTNPL
ncbi:MAG: aldehyde dehydrogenase (NADP(+)) [Lutibacter sp.]|uniref:aldehyde dehydrogenase (NADP(+)) n=1 Tax=Lutibacter sp. TaxID=1925666 RepID=UPI0017F6FCD1|nr:aldehyde dehydrogenase (NADP(+)) [Lutibacter sp.]MBT8317463.1 aldehyde dehydrogenase (NADP(+)) [Lutibacter sp.]NNJ58322.1 aldehyde dehydrogenase (NADP(+)) [Lutibacter sp.]